MRRTYQKPEKIGVKKKIEISLGQIEVNKTHSLSNMQVPFKISPYFQDLQIYIGQKLDYKSAAETVAKFLLNSNVDDSQINRMCDYYGNLSSTEELVREAELLTGKGRLKKDEEIIYVGVDGHFLLTDDGWQEVKLGRIFSSDNIKYGEKSPDIQRVRNQINHSNYLAHHGDCKIFIEKFDGLLFDYLSKNNSEKRKVVLLSDGAVWIDNWRKNNGINWIAILDYYHVTEKIHGIAKLFLSKKKKKIWAEKNCELILEGHFDEVVKQIKVLKSRNKELLEKRDNLVRHFEKNKERMDYQNFLSQGLYIGSGFIESSHKYVVQKRMKMSGQRWGKGIQGMLNLRCCSQSNKWGKIVKLINRQCFEKAA